MGSDGDGAAYVPKGLGPCPACGSFEVCSCTREQRHAALAAREAEESQMESLLDVPSATDNTAAFTR